MKPVDYVPLEQIDPNPYQTRLEDAPEYVVDLAASILKQGLLQAPMGRRVNDRVQLAFGHSRLAAFRLLKQAIADGAYPELTPVERMQYDLLPVILQDLDDLQMFERAVAENNDRKELSPIETARAMERYRAEFDKTSEEIGQLFHLSDSAVRNKMRLLKLPDDVQKDVHAGRITEGAGRALITLFELPEDVLKQAEGHFQEKLRPSWIVQSARSGASPEAISDQIKYINQLFNWTVKAQPSLAAQPPAQAAPAPALASTDRVQAPTERIQAPAPPPEPVPLARPVNPTPAPVMQPTLADRPETEELSQAPAVQSSAPAPAMPAPAAEAPKKPAWKESTITLSLTMWPDDGNETGRMVMLGARANTDAPKMRMVRQADLILPEQLVEMLAQLRVDYGGES